MSKHSFVEVGQGSNVIKAAKKQKIIHFLGHHHTLLRFVSVTQNRSKTMPSYETTVVLYTIEYQSKGLCSRVVQGPALVREKLKRSHQRLLAWEIFKNETKE